MKTYFVISLLMVFLYQGSVAQSIWKEIGEMKDGTPHLSIDKEDAVKTLNKNLLKYSEIQGRFTDVGIYPTEDGNYVLVFSGANFKSTFFVKLEEKTLHALANTSCTTSDCPNERLGCVVKYDGDDIGYCSPCENGGKCTKTNSSFALF